MREPAQVAAVRRENGSSVNKRLGAPVAAEGGIAVEPADRLRRRVVENFHWLFAHFLCSLDNQHRAAGMMGHMVGDAAQKKRLEAAEAPAA